MAQFLTAEAVIGGNPAQLNAAADVIASCGDRTTQLVGALERGVRLTQDYWRGPAGSAYRTGAGARRVTTMQALPGPLGSLSTEFRTLSGELAAAQSQARAAMQESVRIGMGEGDLVGRPDRVRAFVQAYPTYYDLVASLIGRVVGARQRANAARTRFTTRTRRIRAGIAGAGGGDDRRNPDERGGRRLEDDRRRRRPEGGSGRGDEFETDWAGRAILERYLRGGPDWRINNDPEWNRYLTGDSLLADQVELWARDEGRRAVQEYLAGLGDTRTFDRRVHAELDNGEGIVGSQFLHGTNRNVGDFEFSGSTTVTPRADGNFDVTINGNYTWHDRIDPNFGYDSDWAKNLFAEIITLGQANPYDIHITWPGQSTVVVDRNGHFIDITGGYPAPPPP